MFDWYFSFIEITDMTRNDTYDEIHKKVTNDNILQMTKYAQYM